MSRLCEVIAQIQTEVGSMPATKVVRVTTRGGGSYTYDYIGLEAVASKVRETLCSKGVAVLPSMTSVQYLDDGLCLVEMKVMLVLGDETVYVVGYGAGTDSADKALNKAATSALRLALTRLLLQSGDVDGDEDTAPTDRAPRTATPRASAPSVPFNPETGEVIPEPQAGRQARPSQPGVVISDKQVGLVKARLRAAQLTMQDVRVLLTSLGYAVGESVDDAISSIQRDHMDTILERIKDMANA